MVGLFPSSRRVYAGPRRNAVGRHGRHGHCGWKLTPRTSRLFRPSFTRILRRSRNATAVVSVDLLLIFAIQIHFMQI